MQALGMERGQEALTKIARVREWLGSAGYAGVLLESNANFSWITAGGNSHILCSEERGIASVVVTAERATVITTNIEAERLMDEELPEVFDVAAYPWYDSEREGRSAQDALISDMVPAGNVVSDLPTGDRPAAGPDLNKLRMVLLEPEVERYRELAQDAAFALESACRAVAPKESELDMAARVAALCFERNMLPVVNLVAADERIARYRHPLPTQLRAGHTLMAVLVARRGGLHASLTRTVCFGKPEGDQEERHAACARIDARMIASSRPGADLTAVLSAAIEQYGIEGYPDEWRSHHQGGLTGYAGREIFATPATGYELSANQAVAWNPSIAGAKSEDTVLVTDSGVEVLTASGHWPALEIDLEGDTYKRPALLIR